MTDISGKRRRFLPFIALGLWASFVLWSGWATVHYFNVAMSRGTADAYRYGIANGSTGLFAISFWGLVAGLAFPVTVFNYFKLMNPTRLALGLGLLGLMLGRVIGGYAASLADTAQIPGVITFLFMPLLMFVFGVIAIFALFLMLTLTFAVLVGIPMMIFNQIFAFEKSVAVFRYKADGMSGYIVRFVYWLRNEALPKNPPDDSKGARFATVEEVQKLHDPAPEAMAFGHLGAPLFIKTDKHVLIMASTRSGKGVTLIIPHLLTYPGSAFVLDPKGENARATGRRRAVLNDKVHYLDPFGISGKLQSRFNPLSRFTAENMEAESKALAAAMFVTPQDKRDHWNASAQQLLAAMILYVHLSPEIERDQKDLPTVRKLLLGAVKETLKKMLTIDEADGLLPQLATSFMQTPEKEFGSIVSSAQRETEILDNPFIVACLSAKGDGPEVDFKAWFASTMTVYLCLSAPKFPTFNRWLRLILTAALDEMTDRLNPPKIPVCFMLDELATLGHLAAVENAVGLAAGYGIQLVNVFQDVAQMRDLYKGRWASFIGNSGVRVLFNLDDYDTAEYWSKFVGSRLIETRSTQQDIYGYNKGENVGEAMRPLIPPDKLMFDYASGKMLVLATGQHPIETRRISYFNDAALKGFWDDPRTATGHPAKPRPLPVPPPPPAPPAASAPRPAAPQTPAAPITPPTAPTPPRAPVVAKPKLPEPIRAEFGKAQTVEAVADNVPSPSAAPSPVTSPYNGLPGFGGKPYSMDELLAEIEGAAQDRTSAASLSVAPSPIIQPHPSPAPSPAKAHEAASPALSPEIAAQREALAKAFTASRSRDDGNER